MYNSNDQVVQDHVGDQDWGFPTSDDGRHHGSESVHERERKLSQAGLDKLKYEVEKGNKETRKSSKQSKTGCWFSFVPAGIIIPLLPLPVRCGS